MSSSYLATNPTVSDHILSITLVGEVETLRPRLVEAVQRLGYRLLGEQPIYAKRGATGGAGWDCSFEVLDYPTTLTISLKQVNEVAIVATFSYEIKSYMGMTKGDRQTLMREAEAIAALASERLSLSACPGCGTPVTDDSHFCRRCGAPLVVDIAELEVHRLTRKTRTAYHNLVLAIVSVFVALLAGLLLIGLDGTKFYKPLLWIGSMFAAFGLAALLQSTWKLHHALNPRDVKQPTTQLQPALAPSVTAALPQPPAQPSVTEGTTELLFTERRVAEPVHPNTGDTSDLDDERLM
jgi:predicted nucleic acid-binding Zn ribbon protein